MAHVRVEERKRYASEIQKIKLDFEKQAADIQTRATEKLEAQQERVNERERVYWSLIKGNGKAKYGSTI